MDVELRHLRALVAIVEAGTITAGAARLGIAQPALSRTLRQLENRVGTTLLDRSTRHLEPTHRGRAFYDRARAILATVDDAVAEAAGPRPLRLGYAWAALGSHTTPLLRAWREAHPDVPVEVHRVDTRTAGLEHRLVDVALLRSRPEDAGVRGHPLYREPRLVALPDVHPLAGADVLELADLSGETIALCPPIGTTSLDLWPAERRPTSAVEVGNVDDWLNVIASGGAVGVTAAGSRHTHPYPGVVYRPLRGAPPITVYVAWTDGPAHPALEEFVAHLVGGVHAGGAAVRGERVRPCAST
ncbi:LysR family transcriptional regulator [Cryptosporangium aurantiacum]|uniref:DNA-binding transcriptional regulator, LysR family n=1 Tax=Cryptosporangium aurantiacum TaxID=134849 RepID=A0A1M7JQ43_9ACTN|nr:LysR family transcriptional regulator [Cryptosporangium aurantiacum]SHM55106.1 DNA-binding transcriptional regulator, LysR family [Cryptosporangium aurantiacum]